MWCVISQRWRYADVDLVVNLTTAEDSHKSAYLLQEISGIMRILTPFSISLVAYMQ